MEGFSIGHTLDRSDRFFLLLRRLDGSGQQFMLSADTSERFSDSCDWDEAASLRLLINSKWGGGRVVEAEKASG